MKRISLVLAAFACAALISSARGSPARAGLLEPSGAPPVSPARAQEGEGKDKKPGKADGQEEKGEEADTPVTEREKQVLGLFTASSKSFQKGRIKLVYDFESKVFKLADVWLPALDTTKKRVRWAQGYEGTFTTVEHGILIGDFGEWMHKAVFVPGVDVTVEVMSVAQHRQGTIVAPVFYSEKKKRSLGAAGGAQAVVLSGTKLAKAPLQKTERGLPVNLRHTIGYSFDGKVLQCYVSGKKTSDTSAQPKFTEGFDAGHVGMAWNGSVQSFIFKVTMEGRLDPDWVAKQLGEKSGKPETTSGGKKTGPEKSKKG